MQIKKEEVRLAILEHAEKEFYTLGFDKASVRKIVNASGTTIGNFYNYFENKEALFDAVVREAHLNLKYFIQFHAQLDQSESVWDHTNPKALRMGLSSMLPKLKPIFSDKVVMLIECSKGTPYAKTKKEMVDLLLDHYPTKDIGAILAEQLIDGIVLILKKYRDHVEVRDEILLDFLLFHFQFNLSSCY